MIDVTEDDIGADIRAAMQGEAAEVVVAPEAVIPEAAAVDQPAETAEQTKARDEAGRFAKANEKAQSDLASPAAPEPPAETIRPPASWSATAKAQFAALAPVIQQEVLKREKDIESGKAQWDQKGERLNRFDALLAPHLDRLTLAGQEPVGYLNALIKADEMLRANPQQALVQIAAMYGVHPSGLPPQGAPQAPALPTQEDIQRLVDAKVQEALTRQGEQQEQTRYKSEWEAFRTDVAHPYADNVREDMAALLQAGRVENLQEAYDRACWANPEVRLLLQVAPAKPGVVAASKPNGVSVTGAKGNGHIAPTASNASSSIEDDIRAAYAEVQGRA